jgi:hypothetical protein
MLFTLIYFIPFQMTFFEPVFVRWFPYQKSIATKLAPWIFSGVIYCFLFPSELVKRVFVRGFRKADLIPFIIPLLMLRFTPDGEILSTLSLWIYIVVNMKNKAKIFIVNLFNSFFPLQLFSSFCFGVVGVNAAHHHPEIFHDGDAPRSDRDWGLNTLDTVRDRSTICGAKEELSESSDGQIKLKIDSSRSQSLLSFMLIMGNFGHHTLHHLFPAIDHWHLPQLYPVLEQTLNEFKVPWQTMSFTGMLLGQFLQASRSVPNPVPPKTFKDVNVKSK